MAQSINTSYAVIVLGDQETARIGDLAEKAADQGAVIAETYAFEAGEAVTNDDLTAVEAVVAALSRAIATRTDIWVPFPLGDFGREEHLRRVSLVLQRHGLNMLMGPDLEPCAVDGGFNPVDFALRTEVRAVDELDHAAIAASGAKILCAEVEHELARTAQASRPAPVARPVVPVDRPGVAGWAEKSYGSAEVARFLGKSVRWLQGALRSGVFTHPDGSPIEPVRVGRGRRRRFTLPVLEDMARACYRQGVIGENELLDLLAVLAREDQREDQREDR